ncbi:MAG: glycosyltransferase family 2 protein [Bryobacterales bacterium]|nr:glycosyltransferase family 2 protein [Bryobacterales bacterium]
MPGSLSIVIPAYNEESRLPDTLSAIAAYLAASDFDPVEILVVDDGSSDGTARAADEAARRDPRIRVLRNPGNRGKGYSVRHGMLEARHDWVLFTDADLSAPIAELGKLREATAGAEIIIGSRGLDRSLIGVHQSPFREAAGRFFNLVMRATTGLPFRDTQCGFKLFRRDAAQAVFSRLRLERFGFDVEALFVARRLGFRVAEVPVRWNHVEGSKVSMLAGLDGFLDILRVRRNQWLGRYR